MRDNYSRRGFLQVVSSVSLAFTVTISCGETTVAEPAHQNIPVAPDANSWRLFRGDSSSTGVAQADLPEQLDLLWKVVIPEGAFEATPAIAGGVCYIGDLDGTLYAIDLRTGELRWKKKTESFGFAASPALAHARVYLGDIDGKFYCFDTNGELQWTFEAQAEINASANFYKGNVLFGSQDATLYCLNADTGKLVWKREIQDQIRCSPTVVGDRSFVAGCDGQLHIIDLEAGNEVAAVNIESPTGVTPAAVGKHVFFGTEAGDVFCVDWQDAKVVWTFADQRRREVRSSPAVTEEMLVIGCRSKNVYGIDPKTGQATWTFRCKRAVDSSPVIVGSRVVVAGTDGRLYLLDLQTGKELWQRETGGSFTGSPAVVANRLVIANDDGVVYCFGKE